ncbi:MAG: general secretion pathway protein GspK [Betaproteobacteria bacterium]
MRPKPPSTRRPRHGRRADQGGFVLALTLLTLAIITVVLAYLFDRTQAELRLAQARNERTDAWLAMQDTQAEVIYRLLTNPITAQGVGNGADVIKVDDRPYRGVLGTHVSLQDARGLVNLNTATDARIQRLLAALGVEPLQASALTDTLRDFTDEDDLRRLSGAERREYEEAKLPPPRNGPLVTPQDLRLVYGWHRQDKLFDAGGIERFTTTARTIGFNPNTAPAEVLQAHAASREGVGVLLALRKERPVSELDFMTLAAGEPGTLFNPVIVIPGETFRITHYAPKARWAVRYSVTLTPRSAAGPWRIDYVYRLAQSQADPGAAAFDDRNIPALPRRLSAPAEEMPDLLAPLFGR